MNAWIKAGAILAGYCLAIFVAAGVVVVHYTLTDGPEAEAESGMRAAGDAFLFIAVFGAMAVVPTVMALRFLRGSGWFWRALAGLALVVACAGIAACVVFGLERLRPFGAPDDAQDASYLAASARISSLDWIDDDMTVPFVWFSFCSYLHGLSTPHFGVKFQLVKAN